MDFGTTMFLLAASTPMAQADFKLLELDKVYIDVMHYTYARDPFMATGGYIPNKRIDLHVNFDMFDRVMFFENMVHSKTDQSQYRLIGWNYKVGFHLGETVDVYFEHFSQHLLDATIPYPNTYDAVGIRMNLYNRK